MIDLTVEGITFDLYNIFTCSSVLQTLIHDKNVNFSSWWQKNARAMNTRLEDIIEKTAKE